MKNIGLCFLKVLISMSFFCFWGMSCNYSETRKSEIPSVVINKCDSISKIVINYFQNKKDTLGIKAAEFILERMKWNYYYYGERQKAYIYAINNYYQSKNLLKRKLDSLKLLSLPDGGAIFDVTTISAQYLINDIELSVKTYKRCGWANSITFTDFCNYILPYRLKHEPIENWRKQLSDSFLRQQDSVFFSHSIDSAAQAVYTWLRSGKTMFLGLWGANNLQIPDLQPTIAFKLPMGACADLANISVASMRAMGIPASSDYTPLYLNVNTNHNWSVVVLNTKTIPFDITSKSFQIGEFKRNDFILSKVYRTAIDPVKKNHFFKRGYCSFLPNFFNDPYTLDVTSFYSITHRIEISLFDKKQDNLKFGYLCIFKYPDWYPIDFGTIQNGKLLCENIPHGGVYLPVSIENGNVKCISNAFILNPNGSMRVLEPNRTKRETIKLCRKYPLLKEFIEWSNKMIGGKFQGSNDKEFNNPIDFYLIESSPGLGYNSVCVKNKAKVRYVRYLSPKGSNGNIAEIQFFDRKTSHVPLKGKIIGTHVSINDNPGRTREAAFDGDDVTFYESSYPDYSWLGLDLGERKTIEKIKFLSRNDKNQIYCGHRYELFYWDNKWLSLGYQTGDSTGSLIYKNIPSNSLLWLRNRSEGKDERPFTYEKGKQVWW